MSRRPLPDYFGIDKKYFGGCFSRPGLEHFVLLVTGWVLTVGKHTISRVILTIGARTERHYTSLYHFLSRAVWACDCVSWVVFRLVVETLMPGAPELVAVVDDTLNKHRGRKICGAGFQHDPTVMKGEMPVGFGLCFVIIGLVIHMPQISQRALCLPIAARLWWPKKCTVKPKGAQYRTKAELGLELIKLIHDWLPEGVRLRVLVDRGYCVAPIIKARPKGVRITGRIATTSALYCPVDGSHRSARRGCPRKKGERLPRPQQIFDDPTTHWRKIRVTLYGHEVSLLVHSFRAIWYRSAGNTPILVVLARDPHGRHSDCVFIDTSRDSSPKETIQAYSGRWSIEITNRETKGLLGSADPQCRTERAVIRAPMIAYWSYTLVVVWFVSQLNHGKYPVFLRPPWYRNKTHITFSDMLAAARRSHLRPIFSDEESQNRDLPKINHTRSPRESEYQRTAKL